MPVALAIACVFAVLYGGMIAAGAAQLFLGAGALTAAVVVTMVAAVMLWSLIS